MRKTSLASLLLTATVLLLGTACTAQAPSPPRLLERAPLAALHDSLPNHFSRTLADGRVVWKPSIRYLDSLTVEHIAYRSDGLRIHGYLVAPKQPGTYPCIIWNRGGNQDYGALTPTTATLLLGRLARAGYVVIGSQYRGNGGSEGREEYGGSEIADVLHLIDVLAEVPQADTSRIGMFGGSRGGTMTYLALTRTNRLKAAAVLAAPSDAHASIRDRPSLENIYVELVDGYAANKTAELDRRSAVKWADQFPKDVPLLILHGNADWRVKSEQSLRLALELDKHRVPYRLHIYEGGDHGLSEFRREFYAELIAWFDKYLAQGAPLPNMAFHGR